MLRTKHRITKTIGFVLLVGLLIGLLPQAVFSQQGNYLIDNVITNGSFEQGFQADYGIGYEWGGFSNGNAVVGWNADTWEQVVFDEQYSQLIQIENATEENRYAGIYQTVPVVPGEQYKLSINGLIRSEEGNTEASDFGYGLQYAVNPQGGVAWEELPATAWNDLAWEEQPLYVANEQSVDYDFETFQTTVTAESDTLTLFIRGWKKWVGNGTVVFNLDDISLLGPVPGTAGQGNPADNFQALARVSNETSPAETETELAAAMAEPETTETGAEIESVEVVAETESTDNAAEFEAVDEEAAAPPTEANELVAETETAETTAAEPVVDVESEADASPETETVAETTETDAPVDDAPAVVEMPLEQPQAPANDPAELPVSGYGDDGAWVYMVAVAVVLMMLLVGGALMTTRRHGYLR